MSERESNRPLSLILYCYRQHNQIAYATLRFTAFMNSVTQALAIDEVRGSLAFIDIPLYTFHI